MLEVVPQVIPDPGPGPFVPAVTDPTRVRRRLGFLGRVGLSGGRLLNFRGRRSCGVFLCERWGYSHERYRGARGQHVLDHTSPRAVSAGEAPVSFAGKYSTIRRGRSGGLQNVGNDVVRFGEADALRGGFNFRGVISGTLDKCLSVLRGIFSGRNSCRIEDRT
jgi:hypothetical protein